jgi:hypothetical protein
MRSLRDGENDQSGLSGKREAAVVTGSVLLNVNHILYVVSMYPVQIAKLLIPPKWTASPSGCLVDDLDGGEAADNEKMATGSTQTT